MKFRKKPVEVEAFPVNDALVLAAKEWAALPKWLAAAYDAGSIVFTPTAILISTLEGQMRGDRGDWIIQGVKGELYPCKPDIFEATYEPAADTQPALNDLLELERDVDGRPIAGHYKADRTQPAVPLSVQEAHKAIRDLFVAAFENGWGNSSDKLTAIISRVSVPQGPRNDALREREFIIQKLQTYYGYNFARAEHEAVADAILAALTPQTSVPQPSGVVAAPEGEA